MKQDGISIALIQETHVNTNGKEQNKQYTWFFSGDTTKNTDHTHAGVAIIIKNDLLNYIQDIQPINDRLMYITLEHIMPVTFINVYMPTAEHTTEVKELCYKQLQKLQRKNREKDRRM